MSLTVSKVGADGSPLQAQIDRLIEKCGQHDLKFRSARVRLKAG